MLWLAEQFYKKEKRESVYAQNPNCRREREATDRNTKRNAIFALSMRDNEILYFLYLDIKWFSLGTIKSEIMNEKYMIFLK